MHAGSHAQGERTALVAFLETLSSDMPPRASTEDWVRERAPLRTAVIRVGVRTVSQRDRAFKPAGIAVRRGEAITVLNDDNRTHNVRIVSPVMNFNSGAQEPGESIDLKFDSAGTFEAHCGIHPTMELTIVVD